ncbi:hypothetical protein I4U23_000168 [Adineta vaga]|nr:hypothetical protein I4U23_000168 [Adineta vaga]
MAASDISSITISSIPEPKDEYSVNCRILNGTNGKFADHEIYCTIIGIDPRNNRWSYLNNSGEIQPISEGLNHAPDHLTKNGINYAKICFSIDSNRWLTIPKLNSGRMFLSCNSPIYIKTLDNGFVGPDINNPTDPNRNIYFDFIEFTINDHGYHGNITRVDAFGELASENREDLFRKFRHEMPNEFKSLADDQQPYRIIAPIHGSFKKGRENQNYFSSYTTEYTTQEILLCNGKLQENPKKASAINRHIDEHERNIHKYYQQSPANFYAKFWHDHSIHRLAYGFPYDDYNEQASYLQVNKPKGLIIRIGCGLQLLALPKNEEERPIFELLDEQPFVIILHLINTIINCTNSPINITQTNDDHFLSYPLFNCSMNNNNHTITFRIPLLTHSTCTIIEIDSFYSISNLYICLQGFNKTIENGKYELRDLYSCQYYSQMNHTISSNPYFDITITKVINRTESFNDNQIEKYSPLWIPLFKGKDITTKSIFKSQEYYKRYLHFSTKIIIQLIESEFFIQNHQQPIGRKFEILFHNILFLGVILELFSLTFLITKLILLPIIHFIYNHFIQFYFSIHCKSNNIQKTSI